MTRETPFTFFIQGTRLQWRLLLALFLINLATLFTMLSQGYQAWRQIHMAIAFPAELFFLTEGIISAALLGICFLVGSANGFIFTRLNKFL
jgi:hypothetical protein